MTQLQDLIRGHQPAKVYLPAWLDRLGSLGIVSTNPQTVRHQRLTNIFAYATCMNVSGHVLVTTLQEFKGFLVPHVILALIAVACLCIPFMHRWGANLGAHMLAAICISGVLFMDWAYGSEIGRASCRERV